MPAIMSPISFCMPRPIAMAAAPPMKAKAVSGMRSVQSVSRKENITPA